MGRKLSPEYKWTPTGGMKLNSADGTNFRLSYPHNARLGANGQLGLQEKINILQDFLDDNQMNPELTLGDHMKSKGIEKGDFMQNVPDDISYLTGNSSNEDIKWAVRMLKKSLHHSRAKMLQSRLKVLNDFILHNKGTFGNYLDSEDISRDEFFASLPSKYQDKNILSYTAGQITPYVNTLNNLHVGEFNNFKATAPEGTPIDKIMTAFDKPVGNYFSAGGVDFLTILLNRKNGQKNQTQQNVPAPAGINYVKATPGQGQSSNPGNVTAGGGTAATPPINPATGQPYNAYAGYPGVSPTGQPYPTGIPVIPYVRPVCNTYGYNPMCYTQPGYAEDTGNSGGQLQDLSCSDQPVFGDANYQSPACCNNSSDPMMSCSGEYNMCQEKNALEMEFGANSTQKRRYSPKP